LVDKLLQVCSKLIEADLGRGIATARWQRAAGDPIGPAMATPVSSGSLTT
jgi:hypothetical protein